MASAKMTVTVNVNRYGNSEPAILVSCTGASNRAVSAALHRIAADVETETLVAEKWIVHVESFYGDSGRVYIELADGTEAEAERAVAVLRKVTKTHA